MTKEDIECIIKWFSHIEQLATDGKTANGFQIPTDEVLATIKIVAKDSREYIEKFCNDSVPKDIEEAVENHICKVVNAAGHPGWDWTTQDIADAFIAGANWQKEQRVKSASEISDCFETAAKEYARYHYADAFSQELAENDFRAGATWKEMQMMKEAVECEVMDFSSSLEGNPHINIPLDNKQYRGGDKVRIIIVKED